MKTEVRVVTAEDTRPLRHKILRPNQPISETFYPSDAHHEAFHVGAYHGAECVGAASFYHESPPNESNTGDWRLRGMAVLTELQGKGIGKLVLNQGIVLLKERGAKSLWCNARTTASTFYFSFGFKQQGDEFDIPPIGPHYLLKLPLT